MKLKIIILSSLVLLNLSSYAQFLTREDSLNAGLNPAMKSVILSGYGEAKYEYNQVDKTAKINLTRNVLFVGYKFSNKITFFSEIEVEDAKVDATGGEIAMEQCVLKFDLDRNNYLLAGLFLPRIGIMNENHLPITFNGNDRNMVERYVIPSTWRELGIGFYGNSRKIAGLNYSVAIMNGLNGEEITAGTGIRDGRYEGRDASATNLAINASLLYFRGPLRLQASGYLGGTIAMKPSLAKNLNLNGGAFGTPVALGELNLTYRKNGFAFKVLTAYCSIPDAGNLNSVYNKNVPKSLYGYYAELAYDLLEKTKFKAQQKQLNLFLRYEGLNLMASLPSNAISMDMFKQQYVIGGLSYFPSRGIVIKMDWKHLSSGDMGIDAILKGNTQGPNLSSNNFFQLGIGYSF